MPSNNPFLPFPQRLRHNNPRLPIVYSEDIAGGTIVVSDITDMLTGLSIYNAKLVDHVTKVYVQNTDTTYQLIDKTKLSDLSLGWKLDDDGGTVTVITYNDLPQVGVSSKIYITRDTGYIYYWSGSGYSTAGGQKSETFIYNQNIPSNVWLIKHNLSKFPSVVTLDSAGTVIEGSVTYNSNNTLTVEFEIPVDGKAYLN